jgi:hypothetical protein
MRESSASAHVKKRRGAVMPKNKGSERLGAIRAKLPSHLSGGEGASAHESGVSALQRMWEDPTFDPKRARTRPKSKPARREVERAEAAGTASSVPRVTWKPLDEHIELRVPDPTSILESYDAPSWLLAEWEQFAQAPTRLSRAAAVGMLARLSEPRVKVEFNALVEWCRQEDPALKWFQGVASVEKERIEQEALDEADDLEETARRLEDLLPRPRGEAQALALQWVHRRDLLESVLYLWGTERSRSTLGRRLEKLDRVACNHQMTWMEFSFPRDPWLLRVSANEPDAWWSALSGN